MSLAQTYLAGGVRRWHTKAVISAFGQTNADHQGRATQLLLALFPKASPALVKVCLHHDVGEYLAGDLAQDFKARCPDFAAQHAAIEADFLHQIIGAPLPYLTPVEMQWLKLVDRLEAWAFVAVHVRHELERDVAGWGLAEDHVQVMADHLGCGVVVASFLSDIKEGRW